MEITECAREHVGRKERERVREGKRGLERNRKR